MAISGSQPAYAQARAGIERAGASRAGAYRYVPTISIGNADGSGVFDGTAYVLRSSLKVSQAINDTPASAHFTLKPNPTGARPPIKVRQFVTIANEFGGQVLRLTRRYEHGVGEYVAGVPAPFIDVECIDWSSLINRRLVTAHYGGQSATAIANLILQTYAPTFSAASVQANLPTVDDFPVTNETVTSALMRLAQLVDGDFYVDADRVVHLFDQHGDTSAKAGTPPAPLVLPLHSLQAYRSVDDGAQLRTRMVIEGKNSTVPIATPSGATTVVVDASAFVDYLVEAGGGGGSTYNDGGGGGAGGLATGTDTIKSGTYPVSIGAGGPAATQGQPSSFNAHAPLGGYPGAEAAGGTGGTGGATGTGGAGGAGSANSSGAVFQALVVAGGGGGGGGVGGFGGGGGAGGVVPFAPFALAPAAYAIVVGGGGAGAIATGGVAGNGANSSAFGTTAIGGGGGGMSSANHSLKRGAAGGSGGGSASSDQADNPGGAGTAGQGNNGGAGDSVGASAAGGGGGAGQVGATANGPVGGTGGNGTPWGPGTYGGGGGGNGQFGYGNGGAGGGGRGGGGGNPGVQGTDGLGGGGGGGGYNGGAGVVIIIYPTGTMTASGGTITPFAGYTMHTFTASGTFTVYQTQAGGGGGGTGGSGAAAGTGAGGSGGPGTVSAISGTAQTYGGGGAGHGDLAWGAPGAGGGGGVTVPGAANTGGGGGAVGGAGGSGIVILSYVTGTLTATGGTIAQVGGRTIHTFTGSGSFVVSQIVLTAPPPLVTDLPIDDATQLNAAGGLVRIGFSTYPYLSTGGAPPTAGGNPPGSNLSADALQFATSVTVDDARIFAASPGWVKIGDQIVRYATSSNTAPGTLTGIPSVGFGALYAAVTKTTQCTWLQQVNLSGPTTIAPPINVGDPIVQVVQVNDPAAAAAVAAIEGGDGVHEQSVVDGRLSVSGMTARANSELVDFDHELISASWTTTDRNAKAGRIQQITIDGVVVSLMITAVDVDFSIPHRDPRRSCTGSTVRPSSILDAIVTSTN